MLDVWMTWVDDTKNSRDNFFLTVSVDFWVMKYAECFSLLANQRNGFLSRFLTMRTDIDTRFGGILYTYFLSSANTKKSHIHKDEDTR